MTRKDYDAQCRQCHSSSEHVGVCEEYIKSLEATIEAQEIIIKDKTAIMKAMMQHKTCEGCKYVSTYFKSGCETSASCCRKTIDRYEPKAQQ